MIYHAKVVYTIHEYYEVEADSPEEAKAIAWDVSRADNWNNYLEDESEVILSD